MRKNCPKCGKFVPKNSPCTCRTGMKQKQPPTPPPLFHPPTSIPTMHNAVSVTKTYDNLINQQLATVPQKVHLHDLIDEKEYTEALQAGYLYEREHPYLPYVLHAQSPTVTWAEEWNESTLTCRGLVTHRDTKEIIARPYRKFFNYGQQGAPHIPPEDNVVVYDKVDGSLGILVPKPDNCGYFITTKGGWESEQATEGTRIWEEKYSHLTLNPNWTYVYEIVSPHHRIVINYQDTRDLILLNAIDNVTGKTIPPDVAAENWPGPVVEILPHTTLQEALSAPAREGREGFVVWHPASDNRVKVKHQDYLRLHAIVTGFSSRSVWEVLRTGKRPSSELVNVPDEFHNWVKAEEVKLTKAYETMLSGLRAEHEKIHRTVSRTTQTEQGTGEYMKNYVAAIGDSDNRALLIMFARGEERNRGKINDNIWKRLRPTSESNARWF